ncbi:MAG: hypothetical protein LIV26_09745 [Atopobium sp.]|jgi:hypothetical protein|nr:hypothetical protein [Atopobium sp.]
MPSRGILALCRDLGGTILTFGSGCIRQSQLGACLKAAEDMARSLGFSSFCTFENLEPHRRLRQDAPGHPHGAGHTLAGLSREKIDAALEGLPRAPQPLWAAASASLSGIGRQDLDADMDY